MLTRNRSSAERAAELLKHLKTNCMKAKKNCPMVVNVNGPTSTSADSVFYRLELFKHKDKAGPFLQKSGVKTLFSLKSVNNRDVGIDCAALLINHKGNVKRDQ